MAYIYVSSVATTRTASAPCDSQHAFPGMFSYTYNTTYYEHILLFKLTSTEVGIKFGSKFMESAKLVGSAAQAGVRLRLQRQPL